MRNEIKAGIFSVFGFLSVVFLTLGGQVFSEVDTTVSSYFFLQQDTFLYTAAGFVTHVGDFPVALGLGILAAFFVYRVRGVAAVFIMVGSLLVTEGFVVFMKWVFARPRPLGAFDILSDPGFPSGHAALSVSLAVLLIGFLLGRMQQGWRRIIISAFLLCTAFAVSFSRVVLDVHYMSDIVAGVFLGLSISMLAVGVYREYEPV